jgi:hypothetical protein
VESPGAQLQSSKVLNSDAPFRIRSFVVLPRENLQFIPDNGARNVSTGSHLWIAAEVSPIPISVWGGCWFKCGWSMAKTQQHERCSTQNWTGMYREVRATLTSVSKLS